MSPRRPAQASELPGKWHQEITRKLIRLGNPGLDVARARVQRICWARVPGLIIGTQVCFCSSAEEFEALIRFGSHFTSHEALQNSYARYATRACNRCCRRFSPAGVF